MDNPNRPEERVIREERVVRDEPLTTRRRRTVVERRVGSGPGFGMNPLGAVLAIALAIFILVLIFGFLV